MSLQLDSTYDGKLQVPEPLTKTAVSRTVIICVQNLSAEMIMYAELIC